MPVSSNFRLIQLSSAIFLTFIVVGLPLPVLPLYLHNNLGFGPAMTGAAVGIHFLTTVAVRGVAGRIADTHGGKLAAMIGIFMCSLAGLPYLLVAIPGLSPGEQFTLLAVGRVFLGIGHSLLGTGNLTWGFGIVGPTHMGRVIAWTGIAAYGAVAVGAPIGLFLWESEGIMAVGVATCILPLISLCLDGTVPATKPVQGDRPGMGDIVRHILKPGICLTLHGVGYATICAFITLYFRANSWGSAGLALTCFGLSFALARVFFGELPDKMDGKKLTRICFAGQCAGLVVVGLAQTPIMAFVGISLSGMSCSLTFPAVGVQILRSVPAQIRGAAVGGLTAFQDISYGLSAPLTGLMVPSLGYPAVFFTAAACAAGALALMTFMPIPDVPPEH